MALRRGDFHWPLAIGAAGWFAMLTAAWDAQANGASLVNLFVLTVGYAVSITMFGLAIAQFLMGARRSDLRLMREDVLAIKTGIERLHSDLQGVKEELRGVKEELRGVKEELRGVKEELRLQRLVLEQIRDRLPSPAAG